MCVPGVLLEGLIAHARADAPIECCGLLAGHIADGTATAVDRFAVANALRSPTDYLTDARGMFAAFRAMRERGLELLAIYHSHPTAAPVPSRRDLEHNSYGESLVHLIVGLAGTVPDVRAWWLGDGTYREAELVSGS